MDNPIMSLPSYCRQCRHKNIDMRKVKDQVTKWLFAAQFLFSQILYDSFPKFLFLFCKVSEAVTDRSSILFSVLQSPAISRPLICHALVISNNKVVEENAVRHRPQLQTHSRLSVTQHTATAYSTNNLVLAERR